MGKIEEEIKTLILNIYDKYKVIPLSIIDEDHFYDVFLKPAGVSESKSKKLRAQVCQMLVNKTGSNFLQVDNLSRFNNRIKLHVEYFNSVLQSFQNYLRAKGRQGSSLFIASNKKFKHRNVRVIDYDSLVVSNELQMNEGIYKVNRFNEDSKNFEIYNIESDEFKRLHISNEFTDIQFSGAPSEIEWCYDEVALPRHLANLLSSLNVRRLDIQSFIPANSERANCVATELVVMSGKRTTNGSKIVMRLNLEVYAKIFTGLAHEQIAKYSKVWRNNDFPNDVYASPFEMILDLISASFDPGYVNLTLIDPKMISIRVLNLFHYDFNLLYNQIYARIQESLQHDPTAPDKMSKLLVIANKGSGKSHLAKGINMDTTIVIDSDDWGEFLYYISGKYSIDIHQLSDLDAKQITQAIEDWIACREDGNDMSIFDHYMTDLIKSDARDELDKICKYNQELDLTSTYLLNLIIQIANKVATKFLDVLYKLLNSKYASLDYFEMLLVNHPSNNSKRRIIQFTHTLREGAKSLVPSLIVQYNPTINPIQTMIFRQKGNVHLISDLVMYHVYGSLASSGVMMMNITAVTMLVGMWSSTATSR
ncbi:minor core structural protein [Acrididae reovirus]|nr:minor core structural protein [Acrididae reovirus]